MPRIFPFASLAILTAASSLWAEPPGASYIFPAGGQRGTTVKVLVGGVFLNKSCAFDMVGPGIQASKTLMRTATTWFEGPLLHLPDSQRSEDYPKDMAGEIRIAADATLGLHSWRLATSQGATPSKLFQVGELPEIVEEENDGDPIAVPVKLPVTINGRIFPRQDVDAWSFSAAKGQTVVCEAHASRLGSPLEAHLEIVDTQGRRLAESDLAGDPRLAFTAPAAGIYEVRIHDINYQGSQSHVYRLSLRNGPYVERTFPLGGRRGQKVDVELIGHNLPAPKMTFALPQQGNSSWQQLPGGNSFLLDVDDIQDFVESNSPKMIPLPATCNGKIAQAGEVDVWAFEAKKGETVVVELRAARLGSALDGILTVVDAAAKVLASADAPAAGSMDPAVRFTAPADGNYQVRVQDRFRSRGGPAYAYRLRLAPPLPDASPDFRLQFKLDALTLVRGSSVKLPVTVERQGNFADPISIEVKGLPAGVTVSGTTVAAKQNAADLTFKADADAKIQPARIEILGSAKVADKDMIRVASLAGQTGGREVDSVLLAVSLATPFKIKGEYDMRWAARGTVHQRRFQIERNGFDGPLEISLADKQARHLQGVTGPVQTVPAAATEFDYAALLPPWMETGRTSRVCVMATGHFKDKDGSEHEITFSSVNQNEQMVAVIEPGKLDIALDKTSIRVVPGQSLDLPFKVSRGPGLKGAVRVELMHGQHVKDIRAEAITVSEEKQEGIMRILFGANPGPFNAPLLLRATLMDKGRPFLAETNLEAVK